MTKVVLSIELPGRQQYSQKECEQDKNKEETTYMNLLVHNKKGKNSFTKKETIAISTAKCIPAKQVTNLDNSAYESMMDIKEVPYFTNEHKWKSLSKKNRLETHFQRICESLGGISYSYEILD